MLLFNYSNGTPEAALAWDLCAKMNKDSLCSLHNALHSIISQLYKRAQLPKNLVQLLAGFISSNHSKVSVKIQTIRTILAGER